jgi:phage portal protein BeeE
MPIMVGHSDKTATYASAEAMFSAHLIHTLAPWHELWRQRLDEFVLDGAGPMYVDFDTRYLTQGSMRDRAEWARSMIEMQIMTRNEIRDTFGLDAAEGGDEFWSPANIAGNTARDSDSPMLSDSEASNDQ